jgi:hypothetical protein
LPHKRQRGESSESRNVSEFTARNVSLGGWNVNPRGRHEFLRFTTTN